MGIHIAEYIGFLVSTYVHTGDGGDGRDTTTAWSSPHASRIPAVDLVFGEANFELLATGSVHVKERLLPYDCHAMGESDGKEQ